MTIQQRTIFLYTAATFEELSLAIFARDMLEY